MVRNYVRKTRRQSWEERSMQAALDATNNGSGLRESSRTYGVPLTTLIRRIKDKNKRVKGSAKSLGKFQTIFTEEIEMDLVKYILKMESLMFGLTCYDVRSLAYQLAEKNGIPHAFNKETGTAGRDWLYHFRKRHSELALRQPEATSAGRARAFNQANVNSFFDLLEPLVDTHLFLPNNIYNVDETGITTVQTRPSRILAKRGRRQVGSLVSAERGQLVTVEICMSATGSFIPPLFIFPRVRMKPELMDGAPPGSISACHKSGWMQLSIFTDWFKHFVKMSGATKDNRVLLILDGHATHTKNIEVIDLARENGVELMCLPPHCSHKMQPLDVSFMKPLSSFYDQELEKWLRNNPGRVVTTFQVAEIFGKAYLRAATPQTAAHGFRKSGIFPTNRHTFQPQDFAAAEPTDLPMEETTAPLNPPPAGTSCQTSSDPNVIISNPPRDPYPATDPNPTKETASSSPEPSVSGVISSSISTAIASVSPVSFHAIAASSSSPRDPYPATAAHPTKETAPSSPEPSVSGVISPSIPTAVAPVSPVSFHAIAASSSSPSDVPGYVSPFTFSPPPKATVRPNRNPNVRRGKAAILSSSPYKNSLLDNKKSSTKSSTNVQSKGKRPAKAEGRKILPKRSKQTADLESKGNVDPVNGNAEDAECIYCSELWSKSMQDGMIQCTNCLEWAHPACAGIDDNDVDFICELCD